MKRVLALVASAELVDLAGGVLDEKAEIDSYIVASGELAAEEDLSHIIRP